jgi:hypothetical protein
MVQHGQPLFRLAGPWSGIRPWVAVTLRNDTMFGLNLASTFATCVVA